MKHNSGERTLLASVLLSSPGPLILGVGLFFGRSSTQLADFIRRTAELVTIVVSWIVFRILRKNDQANEMKKKKLERLANQCVGASMILSGLAMLFVAFLAPASEKGNVLPALVIAVLGVITNTWFYFRYYFLNRKQPNGILATQSKLYFAKSLVDLCVSIALAILVVNPEAPFSHYVDFGGSAVVSIYLITNGMIIIRKNMKVIHERMSLDQN